MRIAKTEEKEHEGESTMFRILHLSDIHIGKTYKEPDSIAYEIERLIKEIVGELQMEDDRKFIFKVLYGASNSRLVDAFVNTGANAVVGHSDSVYTAYDYNMLNTVVDKMISGESL